MSGTFPRQPKAPGWRTRSQSGFALALALLATVLIAALLAALFFAVNQETRTGSAIAWRDHALAAGETAIESAFARLRSEPPDPAPPGAVETHAFELEGASAVVHLTHLDSGLLWLVAVVGGDGDPAAPPRRIGTLAARISAASDSIRIVRVPGRGWSELF